MSPHISETTVCIVGGGPAGVMLALLLARQGIPTTLLEMHKDFDRDFRGDSLNPGVMEIMEELGLAGRLLQFRHSKIRAQTIQTASGPLVLADYSRLKASHPYITVLPQARFLEFVASEAKRYPSFRLIMDANVQELIQEGGIVRGVRYRSGEEWREVRADLVVGADGRFSKIRRLAGFEAPKTSMPMDLLSFRLPRLPGDPKEMNLTARIGRGYYLGIWERFDYWQANYHIPKGLYQEIRSAGLEALKRSITTVVPEFSDHVRSLEDWSQISFLSVESSCLSRWYRPGLLMIGDAAHVMSSVGGVGVNCAIQDAVVAANLLSDPLKEGRLETRDLAIVQRCRKWPTKVMQFLQGVAEKQLIARALNPDKPFKMPLSFRLPFVAALSARVTGFGIHSVHVKNSSVP